MMNNFIKVSAILLVFFLVGLIAKNCTESYKYKKVLNSTEQVDSLQLQDSIKQFIKSLNISHADIVYAQAVLESGNFTSDIFKSNHNLFGMKEPLVRNTVALGTKNGYAYYKHWEHSIIDYALYQSTYYTTERGRNISRQQYIEKLVRSYASDPNYINKLNKIIDGQNF